MTSRHTTKWLRRVPLVAACIATAVAYAPAVRAQDALGGSMTSEQVLAAIASAKERLDEAVRQRAAAPAEAREAAASSGSSAVQPGAGLAGEDRGAEDPAIAGPDLSASLGALEALQARLGDVDLARAVSAPGDPYLQAGNGAIRTGLQDLIETLRQARENEGASGGKAGAGTKDGAR